MKIKLLFIVLVLITFVWANESSYIVIFAGGKTKADALNAIRKWKSSGAKEEFPQITPVTLLSDTIEGLNPGFYIAVAGNYEEKSEALKIKSRVNKFFKDSYIRKIATNISSSELTEVKYDGEMYKVYLKSSNELLCEGYKEPGINNHGSFISIRFSCGSPCNETFYYSEELEILSQSYFNVIAVDTINEIVAYTDMKKIIIKSIFDDELEKNIERNFSPVASLSSAINDAYFENDTFIFSYLSGKEYEVIKDTVDVN